MSLVSCSQNVGNTARFLVLLMVPLFLGTAASGQETRERTLFSGEVEFGGFGGPQVMFTEIYGESAVLVGGRGGWVINQVSDGLITHTVVLGGGGYGMVNDITAPRALLDEHGNRMELDFGYGGFTLEYIYRSTDLVHVGAMALVGAGSVDVREDNTDDNVGDDGNNAWDTDSVFVFEPSVAAELNVTPWFRVDAGVSYRVVSGVELPGLDNGDFGGPSGMLMLKFGDF